MPKPELLLPVGNPEMFYAAIEGGADAVYVGLRQFNARTRAVNFTIPQIQALLKIAKQKKVKVYLTLNTVIKNEEIPDLLDVLHTVTQTGIDAIIIQDWGTFYLAKKHFPDIEIHASTQMANHNSLGVNYSQHKGFKRVILSRELTLPELKEIRQKSDIELEIFVHGALCYSFSGMCLFSSFLGGSGANRGVCAQPCRRFYQDDEKIRCFFSLKDNQAVEMLPELMKMGIASFKVEGRLKPAEYVHTVSRAYRKVLDDPEKTDEAKELLKYDMGREKTGYFLSGSIKNAISENTTTGIFIGEVTSMEDSGFKVRSSYKLENGNRLRIYSPNGELRKAVKTHEFKITGENEFLILNTDFQPNTGDQVFLAGLRQIKFPNKFPYEGKPVKNSMPLRKKEYILKNTGNNKILLNEQIYIRIDSLAWLRKIRFKDVDGLIMNLQKKEWKEFNADTPFLKKNAHKLIIELPKFIPENAIDYYQDLCLHLFSKGFRNFMLSHISQKRLLPQKSRISINENVYLFNDAAIEFVREEGISLYSYPLENDLENLLKGKDRCGMVSLYFYPHLFYSRMPVNINSKKDNPVYDDQERKYRHIIRDGVTLIVPEHPVSLLQYKNRLQEAGFRRFLIDLSHEKPSSNTIERLLKRLHRSEQVQPSGNFNFKKGLK